MIVRRTGHLILGTAGRESLLRAQIGRRFTVVATAQHGWRPVVLDVALLAVRRRRPPHRRLLQELLEERHLRYGPVQNCFKNKIETINSPLLESCKKVLIQRVVAFQIRVRLNFFRKGKGSHFCGECLGDRSKNSRNGRKNEDESKRLG